LFATALEAMKLGLSTLPPVEREERVKHIVAAAHKVAESSGGALVHLLGLSRTVNYAEEAVLDAIAAKLRAKA
jgi:hypothetical protein